MNTEVKTKNNKKTKLSLSRLILFIVVLLLIGRSAFSLFVKHARTEIVRYGNIEISETVTGYIVKNETIIQSPTAGVVKVLVPEGTKVKKGINVATVLKDESSVEMSQKIQKVEDEIAEINKNLNNNSLFEGDVKKLDLMISQQLQNVSVAASTGNVEKLPVIKETINTLINKKMTIEGTQSSSGENLQSKQKEKENYTNNLNSSKVDIPTSLPGILSFNIDGYEQILTPKNIKSLTSKDFEKMNSEEKLNIPTKITAGQPIVKIVNNFEWYIICIFKTNKVEPLKENDNIIIQINDVNSIPARVISVKDEGNGTSLVGLSLSSNLEQFYNLRKVDIKIIKRKYEGIKIPTSSLIAKGNSRGVIVLDEKRITKFKEVDLVGFNDKYAIVEVANQVNQKRGLSLFDEIIVNPIFVNEGIIFR